MKKYKIGYMCQVDFDFELGEAMAGTSVYSSKKDLKENRKCVNECGIVRVKIQLDKVVQKGKR